MELSDVIQDIKNKGKKLVLGTVLSVGTYVSACADAPDTYNFNGSGPNGSYTCEDVIGYLDSCNELHEDVDDALRFCYEENVLKIYPEWVVCVYNANCDGAEIRLCNEMIDK